MYKACENCPHAEPDPDDDCFCDACENPWENAWHDLIRHDYLQRLDLMGITEVDLENGCFRSETVTLPLSTNEGASLPAHDHPMR